MKCLICGRDLNIGEEVYVTIDGYICSDYDEEVPPVKINKYKVELID